MPTLVSNIKATLPTKRNFKQHSKQRFQQTYKQHLKTTTLPTLNNRYSRSPSPDFDLPTFTLPFIQHSTQVKNPLDEDNFKLNHFYSCPESRLNKLFYTFYDNFAQHAKLQRWTLIPGMSPEFRKLQQHHVPVNASHLPFMTLADFFATYIYLNKTTEYFETGVLSKSFVPNFPHKYFISRNDILVTLNHITAEWLVTNTTKVKRNKLATKDIFTAVCGSAIKPPCTCLPEQVDLTAFDALTSDTFPRLWKRSYKNSKTYISFDIERENEHRLYKLSQQTLPPPHLTSC